jgi:flavin-dependent dehydrogenase
MVACSWTMSSSVHAICTHAPLVEAGPEGWWYSTQIPSGGLFVAYFTDLDLLPGSHTSRTNYLRSNLAETTYTRARTVGRDHSELKIRSANSFCTLPCSGTGWLAIGDAALASDPLSSQGVAFALQSGIRPAPTVREALCGRTSSQNSFCDYVRDEQSRYERVRERIYSMERRWPASPFWARRHHPPTHC